ncbi:hypothetical protein ACE6H2_021162 [Prunus campanulata]
MATIAAITKIYAAAEDRVLDQDSVSEQLEEEEEDNVSLSDLPVNLKKQDQTQYPSSKSEPTHVNIEAQDEEFDFGSSMRGTSFWADTKMCAADEVFFQGQILPLRLSVSSDAGFAGLTRRSPASSVGFRSNSCRSRISPNSSFSSNSSSTTTTTATTTATRGIASSSKRRSPRRPRNQFYTEPSPKAQIKIPNPILEKAGSRRHNSSMWDFFRLGLVRTPDIELQDINKALRSNSSANKSSVSRNSSVSSTHSTNFIANYNNATSAGGVLKSEDTKQSKQSKQRKQRFFGSIHGCKCSFETVASDNLIVKSKSSSSGRSSSSHINERRTETEYSAAHAMLKEKVEVELKMMKNNRQKQKQKQKQKQAMSHHRTYEWLRQLSHANSPPPLPVDV